MAVRAASPTPRKSAFNLGQKVMHPLYGIGTVEKVEDKSVLGQTRRFHIISFQNDRLKIMANLDQPNHLIRKLISRDEVARVMDFLRTCCGTTPPSSSERYNLNLKKIKTADIYQLAEVIKDLQDLSRVKKLSPKEQTMLKQSKKMLASECSFVSKVSEEEMDQLIEQIVKEP